MQGLSAATKVAVTQLLELKVSEGEEKRCVEWD